VNTILFDNIQSLPELSDSGFSVFQNFIIKGVFFMQRNAHLFKLIVLSMLVALGVVISPILRIEGMCPMAHFINITCAVLLGPWYALLCATTIGLLRMLLMGIPPLALTGAVFGAVLSGLLYRASGGKLICAVLGEVIGTGLIGAIVSYPVMALLYGKTELTWMFYVPLFISGTLIGGTIAYFFLIAMRKNGMLKTMQQKLGAKIYDK
jgi:energy coupling factor transporter S component ThiW